MDALEYWNYNISDSISYVANGLFDFVPCSDDVFAQLVAVYASSFEHGSQQAIITAHERNEIINCQSQHQKDAKEQQSLSSSKVQRPCQLHKPADYCCDFLDVHNHEHRS